MAAKETRTTISPAAGVAEMAHLGSRMLTGARLLNQVRDGDVAIATTPKDLVWQQDKVSLHHFRPMTRAAPCVPRC